MLHAGCLEYMRYIVFSFCQYLQYFRNIQYLSTYNILAVYSKLDIYV